MTKSEDNPAITLAVVRLVVATVALLVLTALAGQPVAEAALPTQGSKEVRRLQTVLNTEGLRRLGPAYACYVAKISLDHSTVFLNVTTSQALPLARRILREHHATAFAKAQLDSDPAFGARHRQAVFDEIKRRLIASPFAGQLTVYLNRNIGGGASYTDRCPRVALVANHFNPQETSEETAPARAWMAQQATEFAPVVLLGGPIAMAL